MVGGSSQRWFAPGFTDRAPQVAGRLLTSLVEADASSYARACEALADFDLRGQEVRVPLTVVAGEHDEVVTPEAAREAARETGRDVRVMPGVAHLPPAEDPRGTADLLVEVLTGARA
jgi:pimeloyl-ACP methyl ester carboxylesterase